MRFSNAASVDRCATSSFLSTSFSSIHSVPVCLHACMSTHTRFPIIPSPHPPHLLRFSRPSLKHSFRLSLSVSLCFLSSFSSFYHIFPTHQSSLRSFVFLLPPTLSPLFLLFSRAFFLPLLFRLFSYYSSAISVLRLSVTFSNRFYSTRNGGVRPQQQRPSNQFFLSLPFPTLSLLPPTPFLSVCPHSRAFYRALSFVHAPIDRVLT